ncbi:MAG: membrane transport protein-domain-containing protein [Linnemannia elongata]|nr:MAG: membrane transport protein-domain-containing protein [Linnemannia elongata]
MAAEWSVLLLAGGEAVCQVLVVVACGAILSRTGYLSHSGQKAVSKLNLYFLTPCLLFSKMASTITWDQFKTFYPIPIFYLFFSFTSWTIAKLGSRFLGFSLDEEKFVIASVFFSNTNSLPMALVQSLAMSGAGARLLRDEGDDREAVVARGMSYILFYAIFGNLVRWSYGFSLLVPRDQPEEKEVEGEEKSVDVEVESREVLKHGSPIGEDEVRIDMNNHNNNDPQTSHNQNPSYSPSPSPSLSFNEPPTLLQKSREVFHKISQVLTPPLLTALIALVVGLVPALHQFFMSQESKFYTFVVRPLEDCGAGAIPLILLCLGAQVVHLASSSPSSSPCPPVASPSPLTDAPTREQPKQEVQGNVRRLHQGQDQYLPSTREAGDRSTPWLPLSHASSSATLYQPEILVISTATTPHPQQESPPSLSALSPSTVHSGPALQQGTDYQEKKTSFLPEASNNDTSNTNISRCRFKRISPVGYAILARNILAPLICLPAVLFHPTSLSPTLTQDPVFRMVLVLVSGAPTAINLTQLCQIKGFFEREMASMLFWSYCVLGVPLVLGWALVGLWAAGR